MIFFSILASEEDMERTENLRVFFSVYCVGAEKTDCKIFLNWWLKS